MYTFQYVVDDLTRGTSPAALKRINNIFVKAVEDEGLCTAGFSHEVSWIDNLLLNIGDFLRFQEGRYRKVARKAVQRCKVLRQNANPVQPDC